MSEPLRRGRAAYRRRRWKAAHGELSAADSDSPLAGEDLERLAVTAYLTGRDEEFLEALDRAHHAHLASRRELDAARCAFWIGLRLLLRGEPGPATGWLARARRLVGSEDCVEAGYLELPSAEQHLGAGELEAAHAAATFALALGESHSDADLTAVARHLLGRVLILQDRVEEGLARLDEAMVAVTAGELSPIMTGLVYCSVIATCQSILELARARDWTSALARWCDEQPEMVAFTGTCLVHRAEVLEFHGAWDEAAAEADKACQRFEHGIDPQPPGAACYRRGELHRLRGEQAAAESAYRRASRFGHDPLPGLALLRLAQGRTSSASAAIRRLESTTRARLHRLSLLPAFVEIMLAAGELEAARRAGRELDQIAARIGTAVLAAEAATARGAVELAGGETIAALGSLRRARDGWLRVGAPYRAARVQTLVGEACRVLGDGDGAALALDAARICFRDLGAAPELERVTALAGAMPPRPHGLSPRELEVLRLIATGKTNKAVAAELSISDRTVARHVSNIFDKLDLSTRSAATAYAFRHGLV